MGEVAFYLNGEPYAVRPRDWPAVFPRQGYEMQSMAKGTAKGQTSGPKRWLDIHTNGRERNGRAAIEPGGPLPAAETHQHTCERPHPVNYADDLYQTALAARRVWPKLRSS